MRDVLAKMGECGKEAKMRDFPHLCNNFNIVLQSGHMPHEWVIGIIKPIYKNKGEMNYPDNYRGITLLSCFGKWFTSILNDRLTTYINLK